MNTLSYERGSLGRWAGTVLQETYRLGRQLYRSDTGETYEAGHARLPGLFAIKIMHAELAANREAFELFCREADVLSSLRHPHAPQIFDFSLTSDGLPYIVTEHLMGTTLGARLAVHGALPPLEATRIVDAIASMLDAAHARGIVHGRLHPSNVLLVHDEGQEAQTAFVKVLELGTPGLGRPRRLVAGHRLTPAVRYQAPEQALGSPGAPDARTDQFALGAIAYAMLTGRDPFGGDEVDTLLYRIINQDPPPLARFLQGVVAPLQEVLDRALAKEPADRFGCAGELAAAFAAAVSEMLYRPDEPPLELSFDPLPAEPEAGGPLALAIPVVAEQPPRPPARVPVLRYRAIALGAAGLALAGLVVGARRLYADGALDRLGNTLTSGGPAAPEAPEPAPAVPAPNTFTAAGEPDEETGQQPGEEPGEPGELGELEQPGELGREASEVSPGAEPAVTGRLPSTPLLDEPSISTPSISTLSPPTPSPPTLPTPQSFVIIAPGEAGSMSAEAKQ